MKIHDLLKKVHTVGLCTLVMAVAISAAVQKGSSVYVYDESGRMLFQRSGQLNGYTINTVSIKKGSNVKVYDERGTMKFQR